MREKRVAGNRDVAARHNNPMKQSRKVLEENQQEGPIVVVQNRKPR